MTLAAARKAARRDIARPLAVGDGIETDVKGANGAGLDALFIADGIHGEDIREFSAEALAALFAKSGVTARAAMRALVW
jgi:ribonucleotide monophosphatase NagD (HAD superfamily)